MHFQKSEKMFFRRKRSKKATRPYDKVRCFSAAFDAAQVHVAEGPAVVHAVLDLAPEPLIYAWCEVDDQVFDYTLNKTATPREFFYQANNVVETGVKCYTLQEYRALLLKNSGFGPFDRLFFQNVIADLKGAL